jgi:DNA-binding response OmpR family regulator
MARIILIDDDELLSNTVARGLTAAGHTVVVASNGFDGVKHFRENSADLILTDINMPHGGLPTIRVLRAEYPQLLIMAMSGNPTHLDMAGALGANRIIAKPFTPKELAAAITEVLATGAQPAKPTAGPE